MEHKPAHCLSQSDKCPLTKGSIFDFPIFLSTNKISSSSSDPSSSVSILVSADTEVEGLLDTDRRGTVVSVTIVGGATVGRRIG